MYKNKSEFLSISKVAEFSSHLAELILGDNGSFNHAYTSYKPKRTWSCTSLLDAKNKYDWLGENLDQTTATLEKLSAEIKKSLKNCDEEQTLINAIKIMDWGQVHKGCVAYVLKKCDKQELVSTIKQAVSVLDGSEYNLDSFDQIKLRMDSGLTKVYSLASERSIIYDSRVAAALLLIGARLFSTKSESKIDQSIQDLELFAGGKPLARRSKINGIKLVTRILEPVKLKTTRNSGTKNEIEFSTQAHFNLIGNWLLQEAISKALTKDSALYDKWGVKNESQMLRAVEAALFMIGADISNG